MSQYRVLLLAGRRGGDDPLADAAGAPHRALLDLEGEPMLERVVRCLEEHPRIGEILVSIDAPDLLARYPGLARRLEDGTLRVVPSAGTPSTSILEARAALRSDGPVLVTTADHALLDHAMIDHFIGAADASGADFALGLVPSAVILSRFPDAKRTFLPFRREKYSGANLFALLTPRADRVLEFWKRAESFRKQPWRMVSAFGVVNLCLFLARRLDLQDAMRRASVVMGASVRAIEMPTAEAAVDVDKLSDLTLVREILAGRRAGA